MTEDEVFFELIDELSPGMLKINGPFLYVVKRSLRALCVPRATQNKFRL